MWTNLTRVAAPTSDLITLADAKAQLCLFHADDDALLTRLISAATMLVEGPTGCGIALLTQTWRASHNGFPCGPIRIGLSPVQAITSITYTDAAGDTQTLSPSLYRFDADEKIAAIYPAPNSAWPTTAIQPGSMKVTFTAGFGDDPEDVPADLIHAVLMLVGHFYENREATSPGALREVPMGVGAILDRYRVLALA